MTENAGRVITMNAQLPPLHIPYPQCGHCGEDVDIDDGVAWCQGCRIQWDRIDDGREATPDPNREGTDVPCSIVVGKQDPPHYDKRGYHYEPQPPKPCILPSGHEGDHICPYDVRFTPPADGQGATS
ncbi:MAG TPA: hypothetical protein VJ782_02215 [Aeromicrobium sp.]|nr:hypothetical protein [Aeromicrobium sp.]